MPKSHTCDGWHDVEGSRATLMVNDEYEVNDNAGPMMRVNVHDIVGGLTGHVTISITIRCPEKRRNEEMQRHATETN